MAEEYHTIAHLLGTRPTRFKVGRHTLQQDIESYTGGQGFGKRASQDLLSRTSRAIRANVARPWHWVWGRRRWSSPSPPLSFQGPNEKDKKNY